MDVQPTNSAQATQLFTSASTEVDGEMLLLSIALNNADNATKLAEDQNRAISIAVEQHARVSKVSVGFDRKYGPTENDDIGVADRLRNATKAIQADSKAEFDAQMSKEPKDRNWTKHNQLSQVVKDLESGNINSAAREALKNKDSRIDITATQQLATDLRTTDFTGNFADGSDALANSLSNKTASLATKIATLSEQAKTISKALTSAVQEGGAVVASLRKAGSETLASLVEFHEKETAEIAERFDQSVDQAEATRLLNEAIAERDRLLSELQIPSDSAGIVTGQLTESQQQQVGRTVEEWLRALRQEVDDSGESKTSGIRALEQQAKRVRV